MRKDVGVDGDAQRIGQLVWMLFLKIYDDRESEWELLDDNFKSVLPKHLRWRNWAADPEGMTGEELKDFIDNTLFPKLQNLSPRGGDPRGYMIRSVFEDAYNYMKRSEEHTSELQSLMRISYAVFCLKKKNTKTRT